MSGKDIYLFWLKNDLEFTDLSLLYRDEKIRKIFVNKKLFQ